MEGGDDEARKRRRERDAENARARRRRRREAENQAWADAEATRATGGDVAGNVVALHGPASALLAAHVRRCAVFLDMLERDGRTTLAEKCRIFVAAMPALSRAVEATDFVKRLEALEARERRRGRVVS